MIEVYALIVFRERGPMNSNAERYLSELRRSARDAEAVGEKGEAKKFRHDVRTLEEETKETYYHFCRVRLVQPPQRGATVPVPKWEVVEKFGMRIHEDWWGMAQEEAEAVDGFTPMQWSNSNISDPYGDAAYWGEDAGYRRMCSAVVEVSMPNYVREWGNILGDIRVDEDKFDPLPYLPFRHPIECDRRVQLRQIRFLYPETATMPMFAALDYMREKL